MDFDEPTYEYFKKCGGCRGMVLCYIIATDKNNEEICPYCGSHALGPLERSELCSLEAYQASMRKRAKIIFINKKKPP